MGLFGKNDYKNPSGKDPFVERVEKNMKEAGLDKIEGEDNQYSLFVAIAKMCEIEDFKEKNHHRYDEPKLGYVIMKEQEAIFEQNNVIIRLLEDIKNSVAKHSQ